MKIQLLIIIFFLVVGCNAKHTSQDKTDTYIITFSSSNPHVVKVDAKITLEDSLLYMSSNGPVPERWKDYITDLHVTSDSGKDIELTTFENDGWLVKGNHDNVIINLSYTLNVNHEEKDWPGGIDGVAFVREWGVMLTGRSLFLMNGTDKNSITVTFNLPETWRISTPWQKSSVTEISYIVENLNQLQESILFAGTFEEFEITRENFTLVFALGGDGIARDKPRYSKLATESLNYYSKLLNGSPNPASEKNHSRMLVLVNRGENVDGEVIGNNINLFINPDAESQDQTIGWFIYTHEFFHLWNGKSITFEGTESDWFKEGITNYYALKALFNAGMVDEKMVMNILNDLFYNKYTNDSGYGKLAPAYVASGFDKDNHWGLVYGGGLFAGICIDMALRQNSNNQVSLDTVMRNLYSKFARNEQSVNNKILLDEINSLTETDFTQFFSDYITGTQIIPLGEYLKNAGIKVTTNNKSLVLVHESEKTELEFKLWEGFLGK